MRYAAFLFLFITVFACKNGDEPVRNGKPFQISNVQIGTTGLDLNDATRNIDLPFDKAIVATFATAIDTTTLKSSFKLTKGPDTVKLSFSWSDDLKTITATPPANLDYSTQYTIVLKKTLLGTDKSFFPGLNISFKTIAGALTIVSMTIDGTNANTATPLQQVSLNPTIEVTFSTRINIAVLTSLAAVLSTPGNSVTVTTTWMNNNTTLQIKPSQPLAGITRHLLVLTNAIQGVKGEIFNGQNKYFYTVVDPNPKFPVISDDELLTLVQQQTFKYFWDFGHPNSGLARERNSSSNTVTTGGSGFGIMSIVVGMERNFISRADGIARMKKIVSFLETADRFHGAWSHWIDGNTGRVQPFSTKDNGGDLVETSFLVQGLLTFRQYLKPADTVGNNLINRITKMYNQVEWSWYRKNNENVLYWHWSPTYNWDMNFAMYGYFEEQITYILAAASPTYGIPKIVYTNGYGKNGGIVKNNTYYNIKLPLEGFAPLFWTQYSYLGMDPHFKDDYADYWEQNVASTLINRAYCITNPKKWPGYGTNNWGLTASDNQSGYSAHAPNNDLGVITPTAALSAFPYTPNESMDALKFFYYNIGDKLWGPYGFYDAFNINEGWYANSYLAIDQGPIIVMIENHRTGLLWDLFMSSPEMQQAKTTLGLQY